MDDSSSDPVRQKIESIRVCGFDAVNNGTLGTFKGFPENLAKRMNVSFCGHFSNGQHLLWEVYKAAYVNNIKILTADLDYPLHSTMLEGVWDGDPSEWSKIMFEICQDLVAAFKPFGRKALFDFPFHNLVLDKSGNGLLLAAHIPNRIVELRQSIAEVYRKQGLTVLRLDDLLHSTLWRIKEYEVSNLGNFYKKVVEINESAERQNLCMFTIDSPHIGSAWDLLHSKPA